MNVEPKSNPIHRWLYSICDGNKPETLISEFKINLSFSTFPKPFKHSLMLYGVNRYEIETNHFAIRIDFQPLNMVLWLPTEEYESLNYEQTKKKVAGYLDDFIKTEKFKTSFLSNSKVTTGFNGVIWSK